MGRWRRAGVWRRWWFTTALRQGHRHQGDRKMLRWGQGVCVYGPLFTREQLEYLERWDRPGGGLVNLSSATEAQEPTLRRNALMKKKRPSHRKDQMEALDTHDGMIRLMEIQRLRAENDRLRKGNQSEETYVTPDGGTQQIRKKILNGGSSHAGEDENAEVVKSAVELPMLPELSADTGPVDLQHWLTMVGPMMADLSDTSQEWWELMLRHTKKWYDKYMTEPPLQRLLLTPTRPSKVCNGRWRRVERRAVTLLMKALPDLICRLMLLYQPGGVAERSAILKNLEQPQEAMSIQAAVQGIRRWLRWRRRAEEIGVSLPDPSVLNRGLQRLTKKVLENNKDLNFNAELQHHQHVLQAPPVGAGAAGPHGEEGRKGPGHRQQGEEIRRSWSWIWRWKRRRILCSKKGRRGTREKALPVLPHGCRMQKRSAMYLCPRREGRQEQMLRMRGHGSLPQGLPEEAAGEVTGQQDGRKSREDCQGVGGRRENNRQEGDQEEMSSASTATLKGNAKNAKDGNEGDSTSRHRQQRTAERGMIG